MFQLFFLKNSTKQMSFDFILLIQWLTLEYLNRYQIVNPPRNLVYNKS